MLIVKKILVIYSLAVIGMLLAFLARIAYFYQETSGQRTGRYFLFLPGVLLAAGILWYLMSGEEFVGEPVGDLLLFGGGGLLILFNVRLQELMTGE